jgi:heterotetrameric sarcosine oxidase gamma subunit
LAKSAWGDSVIATDVSAMYVRYRLAGADAINVLAQGVPIDLESMQIGGATRSLLARSGVILIRRADRFELLVERSYARYAENWLTAASGVPVLATST